MTGPARTPAPPPTYELRDARSWSLAEDQTPSFVTGDELARLAEQDERIVVLTADLMYSNRLDRFRSARPDRFINVGIAEQNMVCMAAGMAASGRRPYVATFASFVALLCAEQLRTAVAYPGLPVRVLAHHAGMSLGFYGTSHHALEDIAITRAIAGMSCVAATDANMLRAILRFSVDHDGPLYIRIGRGRDVPVYDAVPAFRLGASWRLTEGGDVAILATGSTVAPAMAAASALAERGIGARVVDMASLSPLDEDAVRAAAGECAALMTVEEHNVTGGLGSACAEVLATSGISVPLLRHGIGDLYPMVGPPAGLYARYGLDADGIAAAAERLLAGQALPDRDQATPEEEGQLT